MKRRKPHGYWTVEHLAEAAKKYKTRGEFYKKAKSAYHSAYFRGCLDQICTHMTPSRKKNKFLKSYFDVAGVISTMAKCSSFIEFRENHPSSYDVWRRMGIDPVEVFENMGEPEYLIRLMGRIAEVNKERAI